VESRFTQPEFDTCHEAPFAPQFHFNLSAGPASGFATVGRRTSMKNARDRGIASRGDFKSTFHNSVHPLYNGTT